MIRQSLTRKSLALLILGFASGLPFCLIGSTLQAWYTEAGLSLVGIGLLSLIGQPYAYKFFWSPLMDRYIPPFLGRRRGWILLTQIALVFLLFFISAFSPNSSPKALAALAVIIAFCSASQDISISAYLVDVCDQTKEKGLGAASFVIGYRISMILSGAMALILAQHLGFQDAYMIMSGVMFLALILTFIAPEPLASPPPKTLKAAIREPFLEFFSRFKISTALALLFVLIFYKLGDAFLLSFNTTFLLRGLGFSLTQVALANKIVGVIAAILGGIVAGFWMKRLSLFQALLIFGCIQALANLGYVLLAMMGHRLGFMMVTLFIEYFCSALGSTAFIALTMSLCNRQYSAAQYALLNAMESLGRIYVGPIAGILLVSIGWVDFYWVSFFLAWPGIGLIILLRKNFKNI